MAFWQRVRQGLGQAASETGRLGAIVRLSTEVEAVRTERRREISALGEQALALVRQGRLDPPELAAAAERIALLESKIAELQTELEKLKTSSSPS